MLQLKGLNDCNCHHISDTEKRQYLTLKVNSLVSLKLDFMRTSEDIKEKLPIKFDEESSLVDKRFELSNLNLVKGLMEVVESLVFLIP